MVDGEPHGRPEVVGPFHAMTDVRVKQHVVARMEVERIGVALDTEACPAAEHHDPLVRVLVEPLAGRSDVAGRDDALDPHAGRAEEHVDLLDRETRGKVVEKVVQGASIASCLVTTRSVLVVKSGGCRTART
jgi:hypothetical protein